MFSLTKFHIKRLIKKINGLQQTRIHNQISDEQLDKERALYHQLAKIYESKVGSKTFPFAFEMMLECYRAAASIEDAQAQYHLGKRLLDEARFRENLHHSQVFTNPSNERQMKSLYDEALAYIQAAEALKHIEAKRLHGLCHINGWGVSVDKKHGFDLVLESIEMENSWDKIPQIFAAIGLNKPEFFSALTEFRKKG